MFIDFLLAGVLALAGATLVAADSAEPCAVVSSASAAFMARNPSATVAVVPADAAEACLSSVPLDQTEDMLLISELTLYLGWQSTLAYLVNPPSGYTGDRVNIGDNIQAIYQKLRHGQYSDEYHLQSDLYLALMQAYDFHLGFTPDILAVFYFMRGNLGPKDRFSLVSVSPDGQALPELYNYYDIVKSKSEGWTPSPIVMINNQSAEDYVNKWAAAFPYHDKDARYNRLFMNQAGRSFGQEVNQFVEGRIPDGASTVVAHKNGTLITYANYARVLADFGGVSSGSDFFASFCNQGQPSSGSKIRRDPTLVARANPTATGYPRPVILHSEGVVGGYYLTGQGYDDIAVLSLPSFGPESRNGGTEFQGVVEKFLGSAVTAGKKRLVIDLRSNGGGRVFLGYDLFKQLFPKDDPYGATRFRATPAFDVAGIAMTEKLQEFTYTDALDDYRRKTSKGLLAAAWKSIFNYRLPRNEDGKPFKSWPDLFGPHVYNNDNFTSLERYDFNNFFSDDFDLDVSGYGSRANALPSQPPFSADNIVILQDGGCGSTCAVFTELLKAQNKVRQVVIGGTPKTGAMQGIGGSKGAQVWDLLQVWEEASAAYNFLSGDYQLQLNATQVGSIVFAERPLRRAAYGADGRPFARINLRDNIRKGDNTNTPLEFIYEAADCKLFYTADMLNDVTLVWKAAADARWNNNQGCVKGSTGDKSSISGGSKLKGPGDGAKGGVGTLSVRDSAAALVAAMLMTVAVLVC